MRISRASTGEAPPVDTAATTGERSTIDGMMKLHSDGSSATLTGTLSTRAALETSALTPRSSVAAKAILQPARSPSL
jgi:hypothetical protein